MRRRLTDDTREVETVIEQSSFDSNIYNSRARRRLVQEQRFYEIEKLRRRRKERERECAHLFSFAETEEEEI